MRLPRFKVFQRDAYYHLVNRVNGPKKSLPFNDQDKQMGMALVKKISRLFCLDVISACWMGNHIHIIVYAPGKPPPPEIAAERYNTYYKLNENSIRRLNPRKDVKKCRLIAKKLVDISHFMKILQQSFSIRYNRVHHREGPVWKDRFRSTLIEGDVSLWECVKYVELNPVRAGIVNKPDHYKHSSWGVYCHQGVHPFEYSFRRHMKHNRCIPKEDCELHEQEDCPFVNFRKELHYALLIENPLHGRINSATAPVFSKPLSRVSLWTNGIIIGTERFVREIALMFQAPDIVNNKPMIKGTTSNGTDLFSYHRGKIPLPA